MSTHTIGRSERGATIVPKYKRRRPRPSLAQFQGTEDGPLSEFIAGRLRGRYGFVTQRKEWFENTGAVWRPLADEVLRDLVRLELKALFDVLYDENPKRAPYAILNRGKVENASALLRGILPMDYGKFDQHPNHLNTPDGVIDLQTGEHLPHSDKFRFTAITRASYDPGAMSENWNRALEALPAEVHEYVQVVMGQAITGYPPDDDKVRFLQGGGENGKSSFLDAIRLALGSFAGPVPDKVMVARADEHPTELLELRGKRLVVQEEMPQGARVSTKRLKDVAGTAELNARPLYGKTVVWQATHTMFVTSNHRPLITETDHGTWRRLEMIEFPYRFVRGRARRKAGERPGDPSLRQALRTEPDPAVLAWLVEGARRWFAAGRRLPTPPELVVASTDAWRAIADDVLRFVTEHLDFDAGGIVLTEDVRQAFDAWCLANNKTPWSDRTYGERFVDHPILRERGAVVARIRVDKVAVSRPAYVGSGIKRAATKNDDQPTGLRRVWRGLTWKLPGS